MPPHWDAGLDNHRLTRLVVKTPRSPLLKPCSSAPLTPDRRKTAASSTSPRNSKETAMTGRHRSCGLGPRRGCRCRRQGRHSEVVVSLHHPKEYLVKFESRWTRNRVHVARMFHHDELEFHVRPWRTVTHAFGVAMFFCVRLCLEGLLVYAWRTDIAECIIGWKCALQSHEGASPSKEDTRILNPWPGQRIRAPSPRWLGSPSLTEETTPGLLCLKSALASQTSGSAVSPTG